MSATNATTNYQLPLFIGTDKPAWLTDWNGAMNSIDTAVANVNTAQSGTASSLSALTLTVEGLSTTVGNHTTSIGTMETAISGNTGSINTINSLIGNGEPTTTDKTLIGAINEIHAEMPSPVTTLPAASITYDNTTSGLTADDVQEAIDEVVASIPSVTGLSLKGTSTTGNFTAQLLSLTSAYDSLTTEQKLNAVLVLSDNIALRSAAITAKSFSYSYGNSTALGVHMCDVSAGAYDICTIDTNGATFASNGTNTLPDGSFKLYA